MCGRWLRLDHFPTDRSFLTRSCVFLLREYQQVTSLRQETDTMRGIDINFTNTNHRCCRYNHIVVSISTLPYRYR
ncbi:hypothetical protein F2P81_026270 [Scophthalmus maximus]|uniref:Uncharacterized protein n=1 Tax=Scophthalmus maximus TaxID=52904 RepID=A0A6A4RMU3_SCOMX|nr:hypothetical protein F2P81_026270 [Scophthalmus maximus]